MSEEITKKKTTTRKAAPKKTAEKAVKAAESKVQEVKDFVVEKATHISEEAKKMGTKGSEKVAASVKKQPLKAIGIAAVCGAVLGLFFRRKK